MKTILLAPTDQRYHRATHKIVLNYADIAALGANTTGVIPLVPASGTFPAGTHFACAKTHLVTAFDFSDTSINSLLIEIGITGGDTDKYFTQTQIAVDGTEVIYEAMSAATSPKNENAADSVDALFTVAGGANPTLAECTSGEIHIYLEVTEPQTRMRGVNGPLS